VKPEAEKLLDSAAFAGPEFLLFGSEKDYRIA
jgi:hypothetical protein